MAKPTQSAADSGTSVNQSDIKDPSLWRLNNVLSKLSQRINQNKTLISSIAQSISGGGGSAPATSVVSLVGLHSDRIASFPASKHSPGSFFYETDRTTLYECQISGAANAWVWIGGQMQDAIGNIPTDLGVSDEGFLFFENVTFFHQVLWSGAAWGRGPGDLDHADTFHEFGAAPTDGGWRICDGTATTYFDYANPGTPVARTTPNLTTAAYAKSTKATYTPALSAPIVPTLVMDSYTPAGGVSAQILNGTPKTWDVVNVVTVGGTQSVLKDDATNNPYTPAGTVTAGSLVGTPATLTGTISLPGDPVENFSLIKYYRR